MGRRGIRWFATALATSGLILALADGRPARACHIRHNNDQDAATAHPATVKSTSSSTDSDRLAKSLQHFLKDWKNPAPPSAPVGIPTPGMTHPAAEYLVPPTAATPTVRNWHQTTVGTCTPPTPPPSIGSSPVTAAGQVVIPSDSASSTGLQGLPAPAPEPSTIVSAIALIGAFAFGRRAIRSRA